MASSSAGTLELYRHVSCEQHLYMNTSGPQIVDCLCVYEAWGIGSGYA